MKTLNVSNEVHHALRMHCAKTQCLLKNVLERFIKEGVKRDNEKLNKVESNAKNQID